MERQSSGMLFSFYHKSEFHERCAPKKELSKRSDLIAPGEPSGGLAGMEKTNPEVYNRIIKQSIMAENRCRKNWETNWGFLKDYDEKGNYRPAPPLPESVPQYSSSMPNTSSGTHGSRLDSVVGKQIFDMQIKFNGNVGKRKLNSDMICY